MTEISRKDWNKIKDLKELDLEKCSFCNKLNLLNLGWRSFGKFNCLKHEKDYVLCWKFYYKVCLNILGCELKQVRRKSEKEPIKPNRAYDLANCYLCSKELKGASKKGVVKNRNNVEFWGIKSNYKILCLECLGRRYLSKMSDGKRKTFRKYKRRGYV